MRILKKILYILLSLAALTLIIAFIMPREINTSVSKEINAPPNYVYNFVNQLTTQKMWNPWMQEDTTMILIFSDKKEGPGASYSWESKNMGSGKIDYIQTKVNELIEAEMMMGGDDQKAYYQHKFTGEGNKTVMTWDFQSKMSYPTNIMAPIFKYMMKKSFLKGMENINAIVQQRFEKGVYRGYTINETMLDGFKFITSRGEVSFDQIEGFYAQNLSSIYKKIQDEGLTAIGSPCGLYYKWDELNKKTDMAVGVQVTEIKAIKDLSSEMIGPKLGYVIDYYGDRGKAGEAHSALSEYLTDHDKLTDVPVVEEYVTDPLTEKNPEKWLTKIIYYASSKN